MTGIYQSRVLNFLNGQANRVRDTLAQGWRQIIVSAQWTGQILFAPIQWLLRYSQDPDRQITGTQQSQLPIGKESAPDQSNTAITPQPRVALETLLAEVAAAGYGILPGTSGTLTPYEDWSVIDENDWDTTFLDENNLSLTGRSDSLAPQRPVIQGLATLLDNRNLVLIDQHNQVLDVLSPSQQLHIRQQIGAPVPSTLSPGATGLPHSSSVLGKSESDSLDLAAARESIALPPVGELPVSPWQKVRYWWNYYREYWRVDLGGTMPPPQSLALTPPLQKSLAITPRSIAPLTATSETSHAAASPSDPAPLVVSQASPLRAKTKKVKNQVTFTPEWIDAPTESMGYEQTFWAHLWDWLDRLLLWIENWVIAVYQKLRHLQQP